MQITFASYNIRKAVGLDRRRDPERILSVLREIDADVVALQEADRRFGRRMSALPLDAIHTSTDYVPVPLSMKPDSLGWHGNALLVRKGIGLLDAVNNHQRLLHDGRARGVLEAVLWHGGEAQDARDRVLQFSAEDRAALVKFVESL